MFLQRLRSANLERSKEWFSSSEVDTPIFRALEHGGESGEMQNIVKKLYRDDVGASGNKETRDELIDNLKDEIGDVLITLDRVAASYDLDLEQCATNKFNKTSIKNGLGTRLK